MARTGAVSIRCAGVADAIVVAQLLHAFNREFHEPAPEPEALAERVRALLAHGDTAILLAGDPACGVALMRFRPGLWSPALECNLAELYVVPDRRGRGIGRAMMEHAIELARAEGAGHMELGTGEDDVVARALYESLGFDNHEHGPGGVPTVSYFYEREL